MISEHLEMSTQQVVLELLQCINHHQALPFHHSLISLSKIQLPTGICDQVIQVSLTWLRKQNPKHNRRGVDMHMELLVPMREYQYRCKGHLGI